MNDYKIQLGALLDANAKGDLQKQAEAIKDLAVTVSKLNLDQSAIDNLKTQLTKNGIDINLVLGNTSKVQSQAKQAGRQIGSLIDKNVESAISNVGSDTIGKYFKIDSSTSNEFKHEMENLVSTWTNAKGQLTDIKVDTRTSFDKDAEENITRLHQATVTYKNELDEVIKKTIAWRQIGTNTNAKGEEEILRGFVEVAGQYSKSLDTVSVKTDNFISQQKRLVGQLSNSLSSIQSGYLDQSAAKPIKTQDNINELSKQYQVVENAITNVGSATKTTFTDMEVEAKKQISILQNMVKEYRNAENVSTKLKGTDLNSGLSIAGNDLEKFKADAKDFPQITKTVNDLNNALSKVGDAASLNTFNDQLRVARSELSKVKSETVAINRDEKVGINVSGLESKIADIQRISPEINSFKTQINGAEVSVQSLLSDLSKINTQGDFSVVNSKFKAFTDSAKATGIAITELVTNTKKLDEIQLSIDDGAYSVQIEKLKSQFQQYGFSVDEAENKVTELRSALLSMESSSGDKLVNDFKTWETQIKSTKVQLDQVKLSYDKFAQPASQEKISSTLVKVQNLLSNNTRVTKEVKQEWEKYVSALSSGANVSEKEINDINLRLQETEADMRSMGKLGLSFGDSIKKGIGSFTQWVSATTIVMGAVTTLKKMGSAVYDIDTAMTNLYKVTDETDAVYTEFLTEASVKAKELGASISDLVDSSADFARLGYNIFDASELARVATLYKNVGDIDISDATNSIISTMKAFNYGADQAENIVDVFNNVGNKFAISSAGIGEALRNSASSFVEANNTLEQSTALTVGANNVMQDPSAVGTMWKTVSMRIRGATTELESAGLETEGMVKSTADLQRLIKGLTGFDILEEDQETFKSTYDIIVGIGEEYQKLSDINQASLLEALAGKRQGNALASALNNIKDIKDSYSAAVESAGSAQEEQNKYAESLEYSLNVLKTNVESLSNTLISSDILKFFVDLGTKGVVAVDGLANSFAGLPVALSTISAIASTKNLGVVDLLNKFKNGFDVLDEGTFAKLVNSIEDGATKTQAFEIAGIKANKSFLEYSKTIKDGEFSFNGYTEAVKKSGTAMNFAAIKAGLLNAALNAGAMLAISLVVTGVVKAFDAFNVTVEESKEKVGTATTKVDELKTKLQELRDLENKTEYDNKKIAQLETELSLQEKILKIEQKRMYQNMVGTNFSDNFDSDSLKAKSNEDENVYNKNGRRQIENKYANTIGSIRDIDKEVSDLQKQLDDGIFVDRGVVELEINKLLEDRKKILGDSITLEEDMALKSQEYLDNYNAAQEAIDSGLFSPEELKVFEQSATEWYDKYYEMNKKLVDLQKTSGTYDNTNDKLLRKFGNLPVSDLLSLSDDEKRVAFKVSADVESIDELKAEIENKINQENGIEVDVTADTETELSVSGIVDQLNTQLRPAFESLGKAYQNIFTTEDGKEIFTLENVDLSMLKDVQSSIEELNKTGFNIDLSSYDEFAQTLSDSSSTADEVREVINNLATSVLDGTNAIDGMDDSTAQLVTSMLESLGVANAEEVVMAKLTSQVEGLALEKQFAAQTGKELVTATSDEVLAFLNHAGASETARQYLFKLISAEQVFGNTDLSVEDKISKLKELATAYGQTAIAARIANLEKANKDGHVPINYNDELASLQKEINDSVNNVKIDFASVGSGSKAAGKAGKEAADEYVRQFEESLSELDRLKEIGILSEKGYLDELRKLYNRFYRDKEKYLKNYQNMESKYLQGMKSLYESAFSYITKQIDKRIDALQKQSDAQIESLEAQKKASEEFYQSQIDEIDDQIDAIDKEIKAKQELIDTINDAADARQREIDLQKAQYDLERMQNQNTQLVYKDGQMSYEADTTGIREAREEVEDKKRDIEIATIEKVIDGLEKQKDLLEERREALEKALDASNAYWDAQIEQTEKHFDSLISNLEETKSKFEELGEVFENAKLEATLQELGINMEALLSGSTEEFDKLKNSYIGILADMGRGNDEVIGQLSKLAGVNAESVSYLESTKGAFENLGAATLDPLTESVEETATATEGLSTSASEASTAVGDIGTNASNTTASITPLNDELQKLKDLLSELTTLFNSLEFPTPGDDGYAQKLEAIATAFGNIATKCKEFEQIDFSSIIGTGGESEGLASNAEGSTGSGFTGLATAISDAVTTIDEQMNNLTTALQIGNDAFAEQIGFITDEYIPAWEELQTRLAEIIGVGGGGDNKNPKDETGNSDGESSGGDNIIGIMQTGGEEVSAKLQDPWLTSFNDFATGENSIQSIAELIKEIVTKMATSIQSQCESAAKAIRNLANEALNSSSILSIDTGGHGGGGSSRSPNTRDYQGTVGSAFASGTSEYVNLNNIPNSPITGYKGLPKDEKNALRSEYGQPELTVYPNGTTELTTEPVMSDLPKGTVVFNEEQTNRIMNNKGEVLGNAFAEGTKSYPPNIVPINWSDPKNENLRKFKEYLEKNANVLDTVATMKNPLNDIADSVSSINRVVTNNVNSMRNIEINIGDIQLQGVQNVNGLADAIITRLPNMVAQELHRRY